MPDKNSRVCAVFKATGEIEADLANYRYASPRVQMVYERYLQLVKELTPSVPLSADEAQAIKDALGDYRINRPLVIALPEELASRLDNPALIERIKGMSLGQRYILLEQAHL